MTRDLLALAFANGCLLAAGHGVLRGIGLRVPLGDLPWSLGVAYVAGAAVVGVIGSALLVAGLALTWWQLVALCMALLAAGSARRGELRRPEGVRTTGLLRVFPLATGLALAILAVDLTVQPIWTDDAWSIWAVKAASVVELGGLDPDFLGSASVFNADYPLVVPVLELVAMRFCGLPNEVVPLQLGLLFLAFSAALVALLRDRVRPLLLWIVVLGVALAPSLQVQAASAVADLTLAVFFALAGVAGWRWVETQDQELLWLAVVFAAAAVGTKVEGAVFVGILFLGLAAAVRRRRPLLALGTGAAAIALSAAPWELWSRHHGLGNAFADAGGAGAVDLLSSIDRVPRAGLDMARELVDPSSWLALVALGIAAIALALWRGVAVPAALFTTFVALACLASLLAVYWATPLDFEYHVATSVRRVVTPAVLFVAAMTPLLLSRVAVHLERPLGHPRN